MSGLWPRHRLAQTLARMDVGLALHPDRRQILAGLNERRAARRAAKRFRPCPSILIDLTSEVRHGRLKDRKQMVADCPGTLIQGKSRISNRGFRRSPKFGPITEWHAMQLMRFW